MKEKNVSSLVVMDEMIKRSVLLPKDTSPHNMLLSGESSECIYSTRHVFTCGNYKSRFDGQNNSPSLMQENKVNIWWL